MNLAVRKPVPIQPEQTARGASAVPHRERMEPPPVGARVPLLLVTI